MTDLFLEADRVKTEPEAMKMALTGALQHNKTYTDGTTAQEREELRSQWMKLIRAEVPSYVQPQHPITDVEHCSAIQRIAGELSRRCSDHLIGGRLRFGTSQKAFNLYLKYLWRLGLIATPPHCPIDRIVLERNHVPGSWTKCDSPSKYMEWIDELRVNARPHCLADWEYQEWLRPALARRIGSAVNYTP